MPEIAEVYRAAEYIRQHLVGRTLAIVKAQHDENVFGKVGTSAAEIEKAITGKKIVGAGQQGKYFWITMASPPHLLCHFGMAGWFHIRGIPTFYYKDTKKDNTADKEWPPKYWRFTFETEPQGKDKTVLEAAFCDFRRFSRVRLLHCAAKDIRKTTPLIENGPDPNTDKEIVTSEWLEQLCQRKRAPIKAVLLDQANISGIGNWVGDEVLFQSKIHPEQYAHTLAKSQISELHKQLMEVVRIAIETKSDADLFPESWLFKHRWGKGKKAVHQMPNGDKITFLTVGGRTSAIVPTLQKKTGAVAGDVRTGDDESTGGKVVGKTSKGRRKKVKADEDDGYEKGEVKLEDSTTNTTRRKLPSRRKSSKGEENSAAIIKPGYEQQVSQSKRREDEEFRIDQLPPTAPAEDIDLQILESKPTRRGRKPSSAMPQPQVMKDTKQSVKESDAKRRQGKTESAATTKDATSMQQSQTSSKPSRKRKLEETIVADTAGRRRSQRFSNV